MPKRKEDNLSRRERQIMDAIYAAGSATATEIIDALPDAPSNSAVRALLKILVDKGHVKHRSDGVRYIYSPTRSRPKAAQGAMQRVVQTFYKGSVEQAVAGLLNSATCKLSDAELDRLRKLIDDAKKGGRK